MPLLYPDSILQTAFTELTANATTTATGYSGSLLSVTITTGANPVIIHFSVSCQHSSSNQRNDFRLLVDGVARRGVSVFSPSNLNGNSGALVYKTTALSAGSHTVTIQWRVAAGTGQIPVTSTVVDHACLFVEEVTV